MKKEEKLLLIFRNIKCCLSTADEGSHFRAQARLGGMGKYPCPCLLLNTARARLREPMPPKRRINLTAAFVAQQWSQPSNDPREVALGAGDGADVFVHRWSFFAQVLR